MSTMEEIPLVFPDNAVTPRRYFVDIHRECLVRSDEEASPSTETEQGADISGRPLSEALPGAASVSAIQLRGRDALVTSSALVHNPSIISVALSWKNTQQDTLDSPLLVELDVNDLQVIAVRAFAVNPENDEDTAGAANNAATSFQLVLMGCQGTVVTVTLDESLTANTEQPLNVLYTKDYIPASLQSQVVVSSLLPNMVSFLTGPKRQIVMALAPLILTVDWMDTGTAAVWSETQCLEEMKSRETMFGTLSLTNLILGKVDAGVVDLPPTAAVCVASSNPSDSKAFDLVFTLHSDASIRKWKIDTESSLFPVEVSTLNTENLSSPSAWSDSRDSVALCARLYDQSFALGVYIKTDTLREEASDCNIWAFHGQQASSHVSPPSLELKVPIDAVSMIDMSFVPTEHRCNLSIVYECFEGGTGTSESTGGIKVANYPPGLTSIVGSEPEIIKISSLDTVAMTERDRIDALSYGAVILSDIANETEDAASSVDEALHRLDTLYMKYLFRPMFPRGNGTVLAPSDSSIQRALSKLVHGAIKNQHGMSVELETVKTLYEWRVRDKRKALATTRRQSGQLANAPAVASESQGQSVYESFLEGDEDDGAMGMDTGDDLDEQERMEEELVLEVEAHDKRWGRLLYQIWEEEQILRSTLHVAWMDSFPAQVVIRGGVTSLLTSEKDPLMGSPLAPELDQASDRLLFSIEADESKSRMLYQIEQNAALLISEAQLGLYPQAASRVIKDVTFLGRWAQNQCGGMGESDRLRDVLKKMSLADLVSWLEEEPSSMESVGGPGVRNATQIANAQARHAACSCAVQIVNSVRQSRLGKCLLLLDLGAGDAASDAAFRAYLNTLSILWMMGQYTKIPDTAFRATRVRFNDDHSSSSPPNKRLSFGDVPSSILGPNTFVTTVLDVVMIEISQSLGSFTDSLPYTNILGLTRAFVGRMFHSSGTNIDGVRALMPELSLLPNTRDRAIATEHPGLALRLLAPYVTFSIPTDSVESTIRRKEEMSSCLLPASQSNAFSSFQKSKMMYKAFNLLAPASTDLGNPVEEKLMKTGLEKLASLDNTNDVPVTELKNAVTTLLPRAASIEISRVLQLDTTKKLFSSLTVALLTTYSDVDRSALSTVATAMLRLSRIFRRLDILENYIANGKGYGESVDGYDADSLLQIISDASAEMELTFPPEILVTSNEFRSLWTKKFNHARQSSRWTEAYNAALKNPVDRYREENLKLLVKGMVDNGALDELISKCGPIRCSGTGAAVDLYEIASEVILDNSLGQDVYDMRANSQQSPNISDYQGALYALHASQLQWKRAAQLLDLRYLQAEKCLGTRVSTSGGNIQTTELRDGLVVDDLVLASTASANVIRLVKNPDGRFLMSGEFGWYPDLAVDIESSASLSANQLKRGRHSGGSSTPGRNESDDEDRVSRFMGIVHLDTRAVRTIGLRARFCDRSTDYLSTKVAFLDEFHLQEDINDLFKSGYYQYGLLLAKERSNYGGALSGGSTKVAGDDLFGSKVRILMNDYLVPLSLAGDVVQRPTLQQLEVALDTATKSQAMIPSYVVTEKSVNLASLSSASVKAAASEVIRKLTLLYSSSEVPIAVDVATSFLDQGHADKLPAWLERLLTGAGVSQSGAFAPLPSPGCKDYLGDPGKLLALYTERGMFSDACNVVVSVLQRDCSEKVLETNATSRLPEKGNIDYVPYRSIDTLWNLIDIAVSKGAYGTKEEARILKSRKDMESALMKHFELLNISEAGIRSARMM